VIDYTPLASTADWLQKSPMSSATHDAGFLQHNARAREIFRRIVETYLETGEPAGSRHIAGSLPVTLSSASVRNVMMELEKAGLIYSPHTSAGRLPTQAGLRFFVDALLEIGDLAKDERERIEAQVRAGAGYTLDSALLDAGEMLSGLSRGAAVVVIPKQDSPLRHIEFVRLDPSRALVILVAEDGSIENRLLALPPGLPASALVEAGNYLNARIRGRTLSMLRQELARLGEDIQKELDNLTARLVQDGIALATGSGENRRLIVRGQAHLLEDVTAAQDLERIRMLFADLETQTGFVDLLTKTEEGEGVRIYIGSENTLFSLSGSSLVTAPFRNASQQIIGALGIIGPTRLNYARVIPMVDYTARVVNRLLEREQEL
jgi:heat-inducible transcriptional repressor